MTEADWFSLQDPNHTKPLFATFLQRTGPNSFHAGIFYTDPDQTTWALHVAWHHDFRKEVASALGLWVEPSLDLLKKEQLAGWCARIYKRNQREIPYGIRYDNSRFDQHGKLVQGPDEKGLTCATFILAVFASAGFYLVDIASWRSISQERQNEDQKAQNKIVRYLLEYEYTEQAQIVAKQIGCIRVRPSEAVAAGACPPYPALFGVVEAKGKILEGRL
jgi:hypothetical protein